MSRTQNCLSFQYKNRHAEFGFQWGRYGVMNRKSRKLPSEDLGSGRLNNIAITKDGDRRWE